VAAAKTLYAGGANARGKQIFPGYMPGAEDGPNGWSQWIMGSSPGKASGAVFVENYFRYMVLNDATWNILTADVDKALLAADMETARSLNATDPDLRRFQARGGKLILYHGWNDPAVSPQNSINYYESVISGMGKQQAESFIRLYMVPGMQHCFPGPGPNSFGQAGHTTAKGTEYGIYDELEQWVENGKSPGEIVATKYVEDDVAKGVQMTRPLCPYPQIAKYKGAGITNDSANFVCAAATDLPTATDHTN
jgi:feruloyl esterase